MGSCLVQLSMRANGFTGKELHHRIIERHFYRTLLNDCLISSNILGVSYFFAYKSTQSQLIVEGLTKQLFTSDLQYLFLVFKDNHEITKVEGNIFWLSGHNERNGIQQNSQQEVVSKKRRSEIFGKTQKNTFTGFFFRFRLQSCNFIKKETPVQVISCEFIRIAF